MKYTMSRKKGVSTILGTIIFIGILFSAYAPMILTMRQADVYYEQEKHEVEILDDEKRREELAFYVYPDTNVCVYSKDFFGAKVEGPCIIEEDTTTIYVASDWIAELDESGILHLEYGV